MSDERTQSDPQHPWNIPVPVRPGKFRSLFTDHQHCNIIAAPERIGIFGARQDPVPLDEILLVDQQTTPYFHVSGRMGSGRSGVYRGLYLKGIGRTLLAGNWNFNDLNHNTGHLAASSAIREYVISAYVRAAGGERSIVPCQGVLLDSLSPRLEFLRNLLSKKFPEHTLPAADGAIQAITVKPGSFARISNFTWLLHHLTPGYLEAGSNSLSRFSQLLATALSVHHCGKLPDLRTISPSILVAQLEQAMRNAFKNFEIWMSLGIWWGSFGNNFTIDGRFLDLETPSVAGGPFFGQLSSEGVLEGRIRRGSVAGTEIFSYLAQMERFCRLIVQTLSRLPHLFHPIEREFARTLAEEVEHKLLGTESYLGSRDRAVELALDMHARATPSLSPKALAKLREILEYEYGWTTGEGAFAGSYKAWAPTITLSIPPITSEPGVRWSFHALHLAGDEAIVPPAAAQELARKLHDLIAELDAITDIDEMLSRLAETEGRIQALVADSRFAPQTQRASGDHCRSRD